VRGGSDGWWVEGSNDGPIGVVEDGAWESVHALEGGTVIAEADGGGDAFVDGFVSDIGGAKDAPGGQHCVRTLNGLLGRPQQSSLRPFPHKRQKHQHLERETWNDSPVRFVLYIRPRAYQNIRASHGTMTRGRRSGLVGHWYSIDIRLPK
jgi:hypothetical protein